MHIAPTVGRMVWYIASPGDTLYKALSKTDQVLSGQVACVNEDGTVNLSVLDPWGVPTMRKNVPLVQTDGAIPAKSYCRWMPYQIGRAKVEGPGDVDPSLHTGGKPPAEDADSVVNREGA